MAGPGAAPRYNQAMRYARFAFVGMLFLISGAPVGGTEAEDEGSTAEPPGRVAFELALLEPELTDDLVLLLAPGLKEWRFETGVEPGEFAGPEAKLTVSTTAVLQHHPGSFESDGVAPRERSLGFSFKREAWWINETIWVESASTYQPPGPGMNPKSLNLSFEVDIEPTLSARLGLTQQLETPEAREFSPQTEPFGVFFRISKRF